MPILRKKNKKEEKKEVKVEKKVEVKVEVKKEEKKVEVKEEKKKEKKSTRVKIDGRKIGTAIISSVGDRNINGTDYIIVTTTIGSTFAISEEDFNNQVSK